MTFQEFLSNSLKGTTKLHNNYCGIVRKDYPKWAGWKLINHYKQNDVQLADIKDENLDKLVENFYYLEYMKKYIF